MVYFRTFRTGIINLIRDTMGERKKIVSGYTMKICVQIEEQTGHLLDHFGTMDRHTLRNKGRHSKMNIQMANIGKGELRKCSFSSIIA